VIKAYWWQTALARIYCSQDSVYLNPSYCQNKHKLFNHILLMDVTVKTGVKKSHNVCKSKY